MSSSSEAWGVFVNCPQDSCYTVKTLMHASLVKKLMHLLFGFFQLTMDGWMDGPRVHIIITLADFLYSRW